jgi:putative chitinase
MAKINRTVFFNLVRQNPFGGTLTQQNVDGTEAILTAWEKSPYSGEPLDGLGYILATAFGETGTMKWDVPEIPPKGRTRAEYFETRYGPEHNPKLAATLGNTQRGDGGKFYGRGWPQITGRANYAKFERLLGIPLTTKPDLALVRENSANILLHGMYRGLFTGRKLGDYFDGKPHDVAEAKRRRVQARRIINGQDKAEAFARVASAFTSALYASCAGAGALASAAMGASLPGESFGLPGLQLPGLPGVLQDLAPSILNQAVEEATGGRVSLPVDKGKPLSKSVIVGGALVSGVPGIISTIAGIEDKWVAMTIVALIVGGVLLVVSGRIKIKDEAGV